MWDLNHGKEVCLSTALLHVTSHQESPRCEVARGMAGEQRRQADGTSGSCEDLPRRDWRQRTRKKDEDRYRMV